MRLLDNNKTACNMLLLSIYCVKYSKRKNSVIIAENSEKCCQNSLSAERFSERNKMPKQQYNFIDNYSDCDKPLTIDNNSV